MKSTKKILNIFLMIILTTIIIMQSSKVLADTEKSTMVIGAGASARDIIEAYNNDKNIINTLTFYQATTWKEGISRKNIGLPFTDEEKNTLSQVNEAINKRLQDIAKAKSDILGGKKAENATWADMQAAFKKDKKIIDYLTDSEAESWKSEADEVIKLANMPDQVRPDAGIAKEISDAFVDRRRDATVSILKENGTGLPDKYYIDHYTTFEAVKQYLDLHGGKELSTTVRDAWKTIIENGATGATKDKYLGLLEGKTEGEINEELDMMARSTSVYQKPEKDNNQRTAAQNLDDMISDADSFLEQGKIKEKDTTALQQISSILFNIFSVVGAAVALIVGIVIGVKYMTGSIEEKADYKQMLLPYVIGCIVVFGGFGIWKIVITILESI